MHPTSRPDGRVVAARPRRQGAAPVRGGEELVFTSRVERVNADDQLSSATLRVSQDPGDRPTVRSRYGRLKSRRRAGRSPGDAAPYPRPMAVRLELDDRFIELADDGAEGATR